MREVKRSPKRHHLDLGPGQSVVMSSRSSPPKLWARIARVRSSRVLRREAFLRSCEGTDTDEPLYSCCATACASSVCSRLDSYAAVMRIVQCRPSVWARTHARHLNSAFLSFFFSREPLTVRAICSIGVMMAWECAVCQTLALHFAFVLGACKGKPHYGCWWLSLKMIYWILNSVGLEGALKNDRGRMRFAGVSCVSAATSL